MNVLNVQTPNPFTQIIRERKTSCYTNHDQLFKQLIESFFEEFLEAFFPDIHKQIDFGQITFLSEEFFTGVYDGNKKVLDLVVEVKWKETDALIVIHVEPQSYKQNNFNERMFTYFNLLYNKVEKPIIPIAILSYEDDWEENEFKISFSDFEIIRFSYLTLHLRKQNWRTFIKKDNPVAAALLSKMGYTDDERIQVKLEFVQTLARLQLDKEKTGLLLGFFESYLQLTEKEEEVFVEEAKKLEDAEEVLEIPISYEERGKKIGKEEERNKVARKMLEKKLEVELIMELTTLSLDEIEGLRREM